MFSLAGAVPAANHLQLPQDKAESLGLTGSYLYLQVGIGSAHSRTGRCHVSGAVHCTDFKVAYRGGMQVLLQPADNYSMHIDVKTRDKTVTRISISNLFSPSSAKVQTYSRPDPTTAVRCPALITSIVQAGLL